MASGLLLPASAWAQNAAAAPDKPGTPAGPTGDINQTPGSATQPDAGPPAPARGSTGLAEIVVTAQRREQRLQDVPIAITAIGRDRLQANRVVNVTDLSGIAPNVTVRPSAGATQIPTFTSRGITSYGVVPGSDKEFSSYLDGVYIGASRSVFDLPDIQRIEILRGPQGTLFGRNATSGAVSVVTRDPAGSFQFHQDFTLGNYAQFRSRTTVDTPTFGPFSGYVSYVHDERRGDIRNTGAGTVWDRTGPDTHSGRETSPAYLGDRNGEQVFAALKFDPSDNLKAIYKFDYSTLNYTAGGVAPVAYPAGGTAAVLAGALGPLAPLYGAYFDSIVAAADPTLASDYKRPKSVNNSYTVPSHQKVYGHNLTATYQVADNLTLKNIAAYRYSYVNSVVQLDGLGGLTIPQSSAVPFARFLAATGQIPGIPANYLSLPVSVQTAIAGQLAAVPAIQQAAGVGQRFILTGNNSQAKGQQWSDELQANYNSKLLTLTVGGLFFHQKDVSGGPGGITNTPSFATYPESGRIPLGSRNISYNKGTSIAGYAQAEVHVLPVLDVVLGGRVTHDRKSGSYLFGGSYVPPAGAAATDPNYYTDGTYTGISDLDFKYRGTKFTYLGGVNYKPSRDILIYAKYSTGFVSGGSIAGIGWKPETVGSLEGGIKADFLDRKLRTNLALYRVKYKHIQSAQGGVNLGRPEIGTAIVDLGNERAQGVELEVTALPFRNLTIGANGGYTDAKYTSLTPLIQSVYGTGYKPTLLPKFTSNLYAQFESDPIFGEAHFVARADADFRSKVRFVSGSKLLSVPEYVPYRNGPSRWILNTRIGFDNVGPAHLNIAFWTRNLTNNKDPQFPLVFSTYLLATDFQLARTYGLDVSVRF